MPGWTPSVLFSLPHPGAERAADLPLALIMPPGCGLRVGGERRVWAEGETLIFDDSIEHEAWNGSGQLRAVLLFDIWRPELVGKERRAVRAMFEAIDAYRGG